MTAQALRRPTSRAAEATNDSSGNPDPGKDPLEADKRENWPALSRVEAYARLHSLLAEAQDNTHNSLQKKVRAEKKPPASEKLQLTVRRKAR